MAPFLSLLISLAALFGVINSEEFSSVLGFESDDNGHVARRKRAVSAFTSTEIDDIVNKHNELRRLEGASDMIHMVSEDVEPLLV